MNLMHRWREKGARDVSRFFREPCQLAAQRNHLLHALFHLGSPIGRVTVRRKQQWHMIIRVRIRYPKADWDFIKKRRRRKHYTQGAVIVAHAKDQLISAYDQFIS